MVFMDIPEGWLINGNAAAPSTFLLAHGAGAPMDTPFMNTIASGLADNDLRVIRFEFPYMQKRRQTGRGSGPGKAEGLMDYFLDIIEAAGARDRLIIGGKSMGGRVASMIADQAQVLGLVCLGYPFHPPGQPTRLRIAHLQSLKIPTLIIQGERDAFGSREEIEGWSVSPSIRIEYLEDGDHSFKPRKSSGRTEAQNLQQAVDQMVAFASELGQH
jgi:predicted alpha/beta-hydrolase family hydrolase